MNHEVFGVGIVTGQTQGVITVQFSNGERRFLYQLKTFTKHLTVADPKMQEAIIAELNERQATVERLRIDRDRLPSRRYDADKTWRNLNKEPDPPPVSSFLELLSFARKNKMCMQPGCTTCGCMPFRNLLKKAGEANLSEMLRNVSQVDVDRTDPELWYEPFRIVLVEFSKLEELDCPIVNRFEELKAQCLAEKEARFERGRQRQKEDQLRAAERKIEMAERSRLHEERSKQKRIEYYESLRSQQLGNCAMFIKARNVLNKTEDSFVHSLKNNFHKVTDHELSDRQIRAWRNCYQVLTTAFSNLPSEYGELWVVFEYVLPQHAPGTNRFIDEKHIRSDVILVSRSTAMVLEFKQSADAFDGYFRQANKYRRRLQRFHEESDGMQIQAVLVLTKAEDYSGSFGDVRGCSPDHLHEVLINCFGNAPKPHPNIRKWLNSDFSVHDVDS